MNGGCRCGSHRRCLAQESFDEDDKPDSDFHRALRLGYPTLAQARAAEEIDWLYRFVADGTRVEIRARSHDRRPHPDCTAGACSGRAVTRRQGVIMQVTAILTPAEEGVMSRSTRKPARPAQAGRLRRHSSTCAKLSSFILRSRRCSLPARWSSRPLTMRNRWQVVLR